MWSLTGNSGTTAGTNFLGTTDNTALELKVNGQRAFRIEPDASSPNLIGGFSGNSVDATHLGSVVAGGGASSQQNHVENDYDFIGAGFGNQVGTSSAGGASAVVAGTGNVASGGSAFIGAGANNHATANYSAIGAGLANSASGDSSVVGGGGSNSASGQWSVVGGGDFNIASGTISAIGGGDDNHASGEWATVAAGAENTASGESSTVGGGFTNMASNTADTVRRHGQRGPRNFFHGRGGLRQHGQRRRRHCPRWLSRHCRRRLQLRRGPPGQGDRFRFIRLGRRQQFRHRLEWDGHVHRSHDGRRPLHLGDRRDDRGPDRRRHACRGRRVVVVALGPKCQGGVQEGRHARLSCAGSLASRSSAGATRRRARRSCTWARPRRTVPPALTLLIAEPAPQVPVTRFCKASESSPSSRSAFRLATLTEELTDKGGAPGVHDRLQTRPTAVVLSDHACAGRIGRVRLALHAR